MILGDRIIKLSQTTEFRQTLMAKPPRIVHGTLLFIVLIICAAILWAYFTQTEIIVRAHGKVRPLEAPQTLLTDISGERVTAFVAGEVVESAFQEGEQVAAGDLLLRVDTQHIDNELKGLEHELEAAKSEFASLDTLRESIVAEYAAERGRRQAQLEKAQDALALATNAATLALQEAERKLKRLSGELEGSESEIGRLENLLELTRNQKTAERERLDAELGNARDEIRRALEQRDIDIENAQLALNDAKRKEERFKKLLESGNVTQKEYEEALADRRAAELQMKAAEQDVDQSRPQVLEKQLAELDAQYALRFEQIEADLDAKHEELAGAEVERQEAQLELERASNPSSVTIVEREMDELEKREKRALEEWNIRKQTQGAGVDTLRSKLSNLQLRRDKAEIRATLSGVLTSSPPSVGDVIDVGQVVATIASRTELRIDVLVAANEVGKVKVGMPCRIKLDAFDYQKYGVVDGHVMAIAADSTPLEGGVSVFLVKVELDAQEIGEGQNRTAIRIGMTGTAEIVTEVENMLSLAFRSLKRNSDFN